MVIIPNRLCLLLFFSSLITPLLLFSQSKTDSVQVVVDQMIDESTVTRFVVLGGVSIDFDYLHKLSKKIGKVTGENYYSNGLVYDKKRGMIVPDTSSDEIYAGNYFPRRYAEEGISIEMLWYYTTPQGSFGSSDKRMVIITGIFATKTEAEANLKKVKKVNSNAYINKVNIYMGCMH